MSAFADLHGGPGAFLLPNAWDVASGLLLADAGFPAVGTTSLGVNAAAGLADGTGVAAARSTTVALATALVRRLPVPVTVDVEGGYSDSPAAVGALVAELAAAGAAGVNLEDGRADGTLRPVAAHAAVVAAAAAAAPGLFVNARTDTYWLGVGPPQRRPAETVRRLTAYRDAGASGVFAPLLTDLSAIAEIATAVGLPLNVLWSPGADLSALGAAGVRRVSTGSGLYRYALGAALDVAAAAAAGTAPPGRAVPYPDLQRRLES